MATADKFELELPVEPAYFVCARLFAASLARFYGADHGATDDLKVAVSEACGNALATSTRDEGTVRISVTKEQADLVFDIENGGVALMSPESEADRAEHSTDELARIMSVELVRSLFPDASVRANDLGGHDLTFSLATDQ